MRVRAPQSLERRLLAAYLGAFVAVIAVFALALRFSFVATLEDSTTARLATLARAGTAAVLFTARGFNVDAKSLGGFSVRPQIEGLQWFDTRKRLVASRGLVPRQYVPPVEGRQPLQIGPKTVDTYTVPLVELNGKPQGYVRASEDQDTQTVARRALDIGLLVGAALAAIAAAVGGSLLARAAIVQTETNLQKLRDFTDDAAHELRGPVAALTTTAEVALREAPALKNPTRARLAAIADLGAEMRKLVDDLLILARSVQSIERELFVVDLDAILKGVGERFESAARQKEIAFSLEYGKLPSLYGNPAQIERIVANLIENAIRYTARNGLVHVVCTCDNVNVQIAVRDTGAGIAPEHRERIFDRFWRVDTIRSAEKGVGLGLPIARALARRRGGDVTLVSELGRGSIFTLTLPLRTPSFD